MAECTSILLVRDKNPYKSVAPGRTHLDVALDCISFNDPATFGTLRLPVAAAGAGTLRLRLLVADAGAAWPA